MELIDNLVIKFPKSKNPIFMMCLMTSVSHLIKGGGSVDRPL